MRRLTPEYRWYLRNFLIPSLWYVGCAHQQSKYINLESLLSPVSPLGHSETKTMLAKRLVAIWSLSPSGAQSTPTETILNKVFLAMLPSVRITFAVRDSWEEWGFWIGEGGLSPHRQHYSDIILCVPHPFLEPLKASLVPRACYPSSLLLAVEHIPWQSLIHHTDRNKNHLIWLSSPLKLSS